ncbi:MAG: ribosomal protein L14b/L23e [Monoraphidium minutum]|nr:MAG: ribosomal protein L14b/L23e [Monoraphidium minutum]
MIPKGAFLRIVDNSGARLGQVIWTRFAGGAKVGSVVKVAIKDAKGGKVAAGTMKKAVIVETKYPTRRPNGAHFQFLRNGCVLLNEKGAPIGNRVRSLIAYEFAKPRWKRLSVLGRRMY